MLRNAFSILGRIEGGEALKSVLGSQNCLRPFSILGRIEGGEAVNPTDETIIIKSFQYPRPDRRG